MALMFSIYCTMFRDVYNWVLFYGGGIQGFGDAEGKERGKKENNDTNLKGIITKHWKYNTI